MTDIIRIGIDTSKNLFQLHGVDAAEQPVQLRCGEMIKFFEKLPPVVVALEACGASHHWARLLSSLGNEVKLIAPELAKPNVKRGKNDAAKQAAHMHANDPIKISAYAYCKREPSTYAFFVSGD